MKSFKMRIGFDATIALALLALNCSGHKEKEESAVKYVPLTEVKSAQADILETFTGQIKERDDVKLAFRIAGPVDSLPVHVGRFVKKGQLLARMDPRDYQLKLNATQAEYDQIVAEVARYEAMHQKKGLTENDYEKALSGKKQITVKLNAAQNALNDTRLVAPFDGYVQTCFVSEGEIIDAGMPVVSLVDVSTLEIEAFIPAQVYIHKKNFSHFYCTSQDFPGREFPLQFGGAAAKAGTNSLYKLLFILRPDKDALLSPGMSVQVHFSYPASSEKAFKIPLSACLEKEGKTWVWRYENGVVKAVEVTLGDVDLNSEVTVLSGLEADDFIVTAGIHSLTENESVQPLE